MKIFVDTNILLDVFCNRKDFVEESSKIIKLCETNIIEGYISTLSIANIAYILRKELEREKLKSIISKLELIFRIQDLKADDLKKATEFDIKDFEDAIQVACAKRAKTQFIITRNIKDFKNSPIPAIKPEDFC